MWTSISGWLYDRQGSYTLPFMLAGIPPICGALLLTSIHFMKTKEVDDRLIRSTQNPEQNQLVDL